MASASGDAGYGDRVAAELAQLRLALDDLRRRPIPLDGATLRHIVSASLSEANAPPPNLLVTAIRRLDRVDARLESIELTLSGALPPGPRAPARGRPPGAAGPASVGYLPPPADAEAIAEAIARRLAGVLPAPSPLGPGGRGATVEELLAALRPLVPGASRNVLRRAGREPSPQAVEVLQQAAVSALEEAAAALGPYGFIPSPGFAPDPLRFAPPPPAPALAPATPLPPPAPPVDVDALAATITAQVTRAVVAELRAVPRPAEEPAHRPPDRPTPPPAPVAAVDPLAVAEAVLSGLSRQPPPQAVLSPVAMAPLLSVVGNVEAAVARIAEPDDRVVGAVDRLEAGVEALARALEEDRSLQADEVRRGFAEVSELVRAELVASGRQLPTEVEERPPGGAASDELTELTELEGDVGDEAAPGPPVALAGVQRRLDRLASQLAPLTDVDLGTSLPALAAQGQRLERSLGHVLTALAVLADHLQEQSGVERRNVEPSTAGQVAFDPAGGADLTELHRTLGDLGARIDQLVAGIAADRQRFQRLSGTMEGLAELLGLVSERIDRLPTGSRARLGAAPPAADHQRSGPPGGPSGTVAGAPDVAHAPRVEPVDEAEDGRPTAPSAPLDVGAGDRDPHDAGQPGAVAADPTDGTAPPVPRPWWDDEEPPASPWWEDDDPLGVLTSGAPLLDDPLGDEPDGPLDRADGEQAPAVDGDDGEATDSRAAPEEPATGDAEPDPGATDGDQEHEVEAGAVAPGRQGGLIRRRRRRRTRRGHRRS